MFTTSEAKQLNVGSEAPAAGYILAIFAAMDAKTLTANLERTARATLTALPLLSAVGDISGYGMIQVRSALHSPGGDFFFAGHTFQWDDRMGQKLGFSWWQAPGFDSSAKAPSTVVVAVNGDTPIRWLAAAGLLGHASPVYLISQALQGVIVLQPERQEFNDDASNALKELLLTLKRGTTNQDGIFNAVTSE
jgi:hypothetical protein